MLSAAKTLTVEEFRAQYEDRHRTYEFWYGMAIPKGTPTWLHGWLQFIIMMLLEEAGYSMGSEVKLRIDLGAGPKPDIIATRDPAQIPEGSCPIRAMEIVVEVLSPDDKSWVIEEHCERYAEWSLD